MAGWSWYAMQRTIIRFQGPNSALRKALGNDWKGKVTPAIYVVGIALAFVAPLASYACYLAVALVWFIPDRRVEAALSAT